ncbi:hypothetical protein [Mameliella alba]|uniref:hypothetical protein n=1 Tax=Mameliella alba TaxID=561184 RepID=UPI000B5330F0|nr:hypothetical protein [Mameliella alba]MBY6121069.1 hypothetical protein [Mameliella alba]OWV41959.1 hypothetical protein CDZ95_15475 [Mameliella alba]OWV62241.1 hypothetical protein CDZ97_15850 [Mameliella alba]
MSNSGTNTGQIDGSLALNAGNDVVVNGGAIVGDVDLGSENDFFRATGDGVVTGRVIGETGDDGFTGFAGFDLLAGH